MGTNRIKRGRNRTPSGLTITEAFYVSGAKYDDPLPIGGNKWEWFDLWCGGKKIAEERRQYIEVLRKANLRGSDACVAS